ncbi:MAG: thermonuclease family protein [Atribacterota bacterium]|nr:thermonuclease family protein [Atribacterota bacterium]
MFKNKKISNWQDGNSGFFKDSTKFRLANVRAPEKHQLEGSRATKVVFGMTSRSNGSVNVRIVGKDRYERQIVNMSNKEGSINQRMRSKGYVNKGR